MDVVKAAQLSGRTLEKVVVHPLVLLSIVDHYNRVARDTRKRVVGVLLGTQRGLHRTPEPLHLVRGGGSERALVNLNHLGLVGEVERLPQIEGGPARDQSSRRQIPLHLRRENTRSLRRPA